MNHYAIQPNSFAAACEEMRCTSAAYRSAEMKETVVCPKPRRLGRLHSTGGLSEPSLVRPLRWHASYHQEVFDSKAGNELLDIIILAKGGCCGDHSSVAQAASSPPFFSGSPPSRVSNPLIQDARFGDDKSAPMVARAVPVLSGPPPSPSSTRKGGCTRPSFGSNPAVRIEGFDCLDRDRRSCSIPALA